MTEEGKKKSDTAPESVEPKPTQATPENLPKQTEAPAPPKNPPSPPPIVATPQMTQPKKTEMAAPPVQSKPISTEDFPPPARTPKELELERLALYPEAPFDPARPTGVLLRDEIDYYATQYKMIYPFKRDQLKPAAYELSVGEIYAMDGKITRLGPGEKLAILPFSVAVIQTLETLNLPHHLIARWNVRTRWAYKGLLWVGAAQVDAGFRGYLSCPLYNLSNKQVEVAYGEAIAVIDFVTTTAPTPSSKPFYQWQNRSRVTFDEYEPNKLLSALETDVKNALTVFKDELGETKTKLGGQLTAAQTRIDTFVSTTFTVLAMLFAALGLAVAKTTESSFWSSTIWLAALALWFAMRAYALTKSRLQDTARENGKLWNRTRVPWQAELVIGLMVAGVLFFAQFSESKRVDNRLSSVQTQLGEAQTHLREARQAVQDSNKQIDDLKAANSNVLKELEDLRANVEALKKKEHK